MPRQPRVRAPGRPVRLQQEGRAGARAEGEAVPAACGAEAVPEEQAGAEAPLEESLAWGERLGAGRLRDRECSGTTESPGEP